MVLNICNFIQRTEQVPVELDISAIEEYILLLLNRSIKVYKQGMVYQASKIITCTG